MGLDIPNSFSSYTFRPISAKLYKDIGYYEEIQATTFLANQPSFKKIMAL